MERTKGASTMDVRVLGQIEAIGDHPHRLGGRTQRRVFAALVAHRGEPVSVDGLIEICWPGGDRPERAEHNVRTYLHRLRTSLREDGDAIETTGNGYRLQVPNDALDLERFESLAATATRLLDTGATAEAIDAIGAAEELWRGRPYGEFADEPWAVAEAAHLCELRWSMLERRAEALLMSGRAGDAVAYLERLIRDEPLRERPRALLMRALYESGRQTEALRAFQDFRRFLIDDAGVEPSPDLVELDRAIASGTLDASGPTRTVGNYELHEQIGRGAFAVVHRATQASLGREVAIKVIRAELADDPAFVRRFEAEAQMVASIEHPNVVPLYDYWRQPGQAYLVMRWMTGGSLEQRLDDGPWALEETLTLIDEVAAALDAAHARDVVHRDVKPGNILFDDDGRAYLGDFGIALAADERSTPQAALSEGSPVFASPEQLRREPAGPEADVHALGIVAFTMLAGRTPFDDARDDAERLRRQLADPMPPISTIRPDIPAAVDGVIASATAKQPNQRHPTAGGFAAALRAAASGTVVSPVQVHAERSNPYLGLRAFTEADAATFHGRTRLVRELVDSCAEPDRRLLAVVGPSGSGKSSVVRAGLIPALRSNAVRGSGGWFITTMIPGAHPFEALETALLRVATNPPAALLDQLRDGDRGIHRGVARIVPDGGDTVLVVIDQFEELFTTTNDDERQRFLRALAAAVTEPSGSLRIIATMRADFYDQPLRHPEFAPLFKAGTVAITPLAPDELEEAITAPAATVGVGYEPGLIAEIVADVNSQPGALPLLQYALTQTFDATDGDTITTAAYRDIGGLSGALGRRAEELHEAASADERQATRRLFGRLVALGEGTEDTRRRIRRSELADDPAAAEVLDRFGRARLLTFDRDPATREPTIEIAHEALIREWPRLRGWLDDDRDGLRIHRHLTETATAWTASGRDDGELYRGARLEAATTWASEHGDDLNDDEAEFLTTSIAAHRAEQAAERQRFDDQIRANRRLRTLAAVTTVIALIAVGIGIYAIQQADAALTAEQRADIERLRAVASARAAEDPRLAALLAVEAHRLDPTFESIDTLHRVLTENPGFLGSFGARNYLDGVLIDDRTLAAATESGVIEIWEVPDQTLVGSIDHAMSDGTTTIAWAGDGRIAAIDETRTAITVYDAATGDAITTLQYQPGVGVIDFAVSADGNSLAAALADGSIEIRSIDDHDLVTELDADPGGVDLIRWHPDGRRIAVATRAGRVQLWDVDEPRREWEWETEAEDIDVLGSPSSLSVSPNGDRIVVLLGTQGGQLHTLDVATGDQAHSEINVVTARTSFTNDIVWTDEDTILVPGESGTDSFDLAAGTSEPVLDEYGTTAQAVAYLEPDGRLAVIGLKGIELWSPNGAGPLRTVLPYQPEHETALDHGTLFSVYTSLRADGTKLLVSVLPTGPSQPTYEFDLTREPAAASVADGRGTVVGYGDFTFEVGPDFRASMLGPDLQPLGEPVPFPTDAFSTSASADGRYFAFGRTGGKADLHDSTGQFIATLHLGDEAEFAGVGAVVSFTSDGEYLALHAAGTQAAIWQTSTLERVDLPAWMANTWVEVDGPWIFASHENGTVQRYDPATLEPAGEPVLSGGRLGWPFPRVDEAHLRVASAGYGDDAAKVYDLTAGRQLGRDLPYVAGFARLEWSADGSMLTVPDPDGVSLWNFDTDTWADIACRFAGTNLTQDEWDQFGPRGVEYRATCEQYPIET